LKNVTDLCFVEARPDEPPQILIRRFGKKVQAAMIAREVRARRHHLTRSEEKRRKHASHLRRLRKAAQQSEQRYQRKLVKRAT
jgi:ribosomal protein S21